MKKKYILTTYLILLTLLTNAQSTNIKLQLKWWHQFQFAGYYAANIKGYFKDAGLNVEIIPSDKENPPIPAVLNGKADFGVTGAELIINHANGDPVKVVGAIFQHSPYAIISLKEKNIHSPADLVGKTVMASEDQGWPQVKAMLLKEGINPNTINLKSHSWNNNDLITGKADAMTGYSCVEPFQLTSKGFQVNFLEPINYGIDFYGDILFTTKEFAEKYPEKVDAFRKACFKGWEYALSHQNEIIDYILTLPGVKERNVTREMLEYEAIATKQLILPDLVEVGHMNEGRWQHILNVNKSLGLVPANSELKDFIFNSEDDRINHWIRNSLIVSAAIGIIILSLIFYNINLKKAVKKRTIDLENEIEERTKAEELLKISEERMELATNAAGIGIWDWYVKENTVYLSDELKAMLGYLPHEIENSIVGFVKLLHPEHNEEITQKLNEHIFENIQHKYQAVVKMKKKDGGWKWVLLISKALNRDNQGRALRLTGIHIDIDSIKNKELELQELTGELMHTNNELRQFAYITSHNLRAPVANLLSLVALFEKDKLNDENSFLFEKIEWSIKKLDQTLFDLNDILASRANKAHQSEELVFEQILNSITTSISEDMKKSQAIIQTQFSVPKINFSKRVLNSIFQNLITNAIKYKKINENPEINITTEREGDYVVLRFADNGIGINMEKFGTKIFGLYQRFNNEIEGKGMGLFIIKNQIEGLHSTIEVESKPNQGTTFIIRLKEFSTVN